MNAYPAGSNVTVVVPLLDLNGAVIAPTGGAYRVLDESDAVVIASTPLSIVPGDIDATIVVPGSANALPPPETAFRNSDNAGVPVVATSGIRAVEVTFDLGQGETAVVKLTYLLRATTRLFVMQNSFQTYNQALLLAAGLPNLTGWIQATSGEEMRMAALTEAYARLTRLGYYVRWPIDPDAQNTLNWGNTQNSVIIPRLWTVMTTERWFGFYPEAFRDALRKAQVAEADRILKGDIVRAKRQAGIIFEKTGESSMQFRGRKPLDLRLSNQALRYVTSYVDFRMQVWRS